MKFGPEDQIDDLDGLDDFDDYIFSDDAIEYSEDDLTIGEDISIHNWQEGYGYDNEDV